MQKIGTLLDKNKYLTRNNYLDDKTIFFVFNSVIKEEYGNQGQEKIKPVFFKNNKIFIKCLSPVWSNEFWNNRSIFIKRINNQLGKSLISDIIVK